MKKVFLLATAAFVFSMNAQAEGMMSHVKPYVGMDYIYSDADMSDAQENSPFEHKFNNGSINAGVKVNEYMGLEAFYQMSMIEDKNLDNQKNKSKFYAYGADIVGYMPIYDKMELIGAAGLGQYEFKKSMVGAENGRVSDNGLGIRMGAGLQYNITENVALRALGRYTWLDVDHVNHLTEFLFGARYTF